MNEQRIKFKGGEQKTFLDKCIENLSCISLRGLLQFGINTNYSNLKNYYSERRLIPISLFNELNYLAKINIIELNTTKINSNWGQVKGGQISKRKK